MVALTYLEGPTAALGLLLGLLITGKLLRVRPLAGSSREALQLCASQRLSCRQAPPRHPGPPHQFAVPACPGVALPQPPCHPASRPPSCSDCLPGCHPASRPPSCSDCLPGCERLRVSRPEPAQRAHRGGPALHLPRLWLHLTGEGFFGFFVSGRCAAAAASMPCPPACLPARLPLQVASDARVDCQLAELLLMDHRAHAVLRSRAEARDNLMAAVQLRLVSGGRRWCWGWCWHRAGGQGWGSRSSACCLPAGVSAGAPPSQRHQPHHRRCEKCRADSEAASCELTSPPLWALQEALDSTLGLLQSDPKLLLPLLGGSQPQQIAGGGGGADVAAQQAQQELNKAHARELWRVTGGCFWHPCFVAAAGCMAGLGSCFWWLGIVPLPSSLACPSSTSLPASCPSVLPCSQMPILLRASFRSFGSTAYRQGIRLRLSA